MQTFQMYYECPPLNDAFGVFFFLFLFKSVPLNGFFGVAMDCIAKQGYFDVGNSGSEPVKALELLSDNTIPATYGLSQEIVCSSFKGHILRVVSSEMCAVNLLDIFKC